MEMASQGNNHWTCDLLGCPWTGTLRTLDRSFCSLTRWDRISASP